MSVRLRVFLEASDRIRRVDIRGDDRGCDGNRWSAHLARDPRDGLRAAPGVAGRIGDLLRRAAARTPPRPRLTPGVRRRLDATVRLVMRDGDVEVDAPDSGAPGSGVGRERERRGLEPVRLQGLPLSPGTLGQAVEVGRAELRVLVRDLHAGYRTAQMIVEVDPQEIDGNHGAPLAEPNRPGQ